MASCDGRTEAAMATPSAGASQSSRHPTLTFGHLIENHVDQDVGATPASAVTANGRREMRTRQAVLPPLPTCPRQRVPSRSRGPMGGGEGGELERKRHRAGRGGSGWQGEEGMDHSTDKLLVSVL